MFITPTAATIEKECAAVDGAFESTSSTIQESRPDDEEDSVGKGKCQTGGETSVGTGSSTFILISNPGQKLW